MSDGGDGFGEVLARLVSAESRSVRTVNAAHEPLEAAWWWSAERQLAIIESARIIGLAQLPKGKFHPFDLDTFGLGAALQAAFSQGAAEVLIGIGGSATNDGGFGLARAVGWQFLDSEGHRVERWTQLARLTTIVAPAQPIVFKDVLVAVDVQNPLLGSSGASRIYGPQKGLQESDFERAEACLGRMAEVFAAQFKESVSEQPGAGAAGGLGFGLRAFLPGARLRSGFELFAENSALERRIAASDLVISGEGSLDHSSFMGKGVGEVARLCAKHGVPCLMLAGILGRDLPPEFALEHVGSPSSKEVAIRVRGIVPGLTSFEEAVSTPGEWLRRLARSMAEEWAPAC
jgi:glycerate kinase